MSVCEHGWPGENCGQAHPYVVEPTRLPVHPAVAALRKLALLFDQLAEDCGFPAASDTYRGYQLAMRHAAERAHQAAADIEQG